MLALSRVGLTSGRTSAIANFRPLLVRGIKTIPQPPGHIVGSVNDAYIPPKPSKAHGSYHWTSDRIVTIAMVPLALAPFLTGTGPLLDSVFGVGLLYHVHAGFQSCITDYIQKRVYGKLHDYAMYLLTFGTAVAGYGLYEIETKEGGLAEVVKKVWKA